MPYGLGWKREGAGRAIGNCKYQKSNVPNKREKSKTKKKNEKVRNESKAKQKKKYFSRSSKNWEFIECSRARESQIMLFSYINECDGIICGWTDDGKDIYLRALQAYWRHIKALKVLEPFKWQHKTNTVLEK